MTHSYANFATRAAYLRTHDALKAAVYNAKQDSQDSYTYALHMIRLWRCLRRPETPQEMYMIEREGMMP